MIIPPWAYAAGAVISFAAGWQVNEWRHGAAETKSVKKGVKNTAKQAAKGHAKSTTLEKERADVIDRSPTIRIIYRDRIVPAACEPEPDAVRVLDDTISDAYPRITGKSRAALPGDTAAP